MFFFFFFRPQSLKVLGSSVVQPPSSTKGPSPVLYVRSGKNAAPVLWFLFELRHQEGFDSVNKFRFFFSYLRG